MVIVEIQKNADGVSCITTTHGTRSEAEQKYHQTLAFAAVSSVEAHSVVMLDDYGTRIKGEVYHHNKNEVE